MKKIKLEFSIMVTVLAVVFIPCFLLDCCLYSVVFTHGDNYHVRSTDIIEYNDKEIVFKTLILGRTVRGNDYRIKEPIFESFKTLEK